MATISTAALQPTTTLPVTTVPDLSSQYTNNINSVANLTQQANDAALAEKTAQDQYLAKANEKANLESSYGMKANDTASLYQSSGVNDLYKQISGLNTEAQGLSREAQAIPLALQNQSANRGVTVGGIAPIQAAQLRENALKSLELGQRAAIAQGNYDVAKNLADQQIASKYAGIDAEIKSKQTNLDALDKITLTAAQEKRKEAQTALLTKQANDVAEQKANEKAISDMIINATPFAPAAQIEKAKLAKTQVEAAIALGKYSGDYLGNLVKYSTINKNNADISKTAAEIKKLQTPLPVVAANGSNASFQANLLNSAVNKESLTAGEREKISKAFAVTNQLGALAKTLAQDQTSYFGGKVRGLMADIGQDASAGAVNAQITALVPQVARGIYGEVGVLTDADVNNYKKVIPNLTSPTDQNKAVTALTLTALRNGVKSNLEVAAASKLDVSGFVPLYSNLTTQINKINDDIGYSDVQVKNYADLNPQVRPMVEELIKSGKTGSEILTVLGVEI